MVVAVWLSALLLYGFFRLWYDGLRKPLSSDEVEYFVGLLEARAAAGQPTNDIAIARAFLEQDDGQEFVMYNLVRFNPAPAKHPETGEDAEPRSLLMAYMKPFMGTMLRRAGHPVITGKIAGGYLDEWNTAPNPGWDGAGLIRYRSRRDAMLASLANNEFDGMHKFKVAAIDQTYAVPTQRQMGFYASPRVTVALVIALAAALLNIALI